ncbi:unnamed protein product [Coregonus sp. 'balchen']|nr:unnamed protein product [Coregonus sp. 'balchen']
MAPVLDIAGKVHYQQRTDEGEEGMWVRKSDMTDRRGEVNVLLKAARALEKGVFELSRIDGETGNRCGTEGGGSIDGDSESEKEERMSLTGGNIRGGLAQGEWQRNGDAVEGERRERLERQRDEERLEELKMIKEEVRHQEAQLKKLKMELEANKNGSESERSPVRGHCIDLRDGEESEEERGKQQKLICGAFDGDIWDNNGGPAYHTRARAHSREGHKGGQYPLRETPGGVSVYKPWSHIDIQTLVDSLPQPEESGHRWVKSFESLTAADELTIGDMVTVMNRCMGDQECREIMTSGGLRGQVGSATRFDTHRSDIWDVIRRKYPTQARPELMRTLILNDDETIPAYMKRAKEFQLWKSWIQTLNAYYPPEDPPHMTMNYTRDLDEAYDEAWEEEMDDRRPIVTSNHMYILKEGVATSCMVMDGDVVLTDKWFALPNDSVPHVTLLEELTTDTVRQLQEAAGAYEQNVWSRQGARQDHHGIWRSHTGKTVGPAKLLRSILREEHEKAHGGWKRVAKSVEKAWWHPHMLDMARETSESCEVVEVRTPAVETTDDNRDILVGDWVRVKVHSRKWTEPRWEGPFQVKEVSSHSLRVNTSKKDVWYHRTHCAKDIVPGRTLDQVQQDLAADGEDVMVISGAGPMGNSDIQSVS